MILTCCGPLFDFYSSQVRDCKSPQDALQTAIRLSASWPQDDQLVGLARLRSSGGAHVLSRMMHWSLD